MNLDLYRERRWGVSIRATKSSKYSLTPLKTARVGGDKVIRLGNMARQVAIASGEMYPVIGISKGQDRT
ncbi:hypothetical protein BJV74DRAFT_864680, partial [Russula compacta]